MIKSAEFASERKRRRHIVVALALFLWLVWVLGQVFRDSTWLTGIFFYIPSPVLVFFLLGCSCYFWRMDHRFIARLLASLALLPAFTVLRVENHFSTVKHNMVHENTLRLLHWNIFYGHFGWNGIENVLRQSKADICVLSEIPKKLDIQATARSFGQGYYATRINNLAVITRGAILDGKWLINQNGVRAYGIVWESPQGNCRVLVVDMASNPLLSREPRLLQIRMLMVDWGADIVVGDFNAPRRSRALSPLPSGFVHAYETAGSGCSYTWPLPCPVYAIDQCILGPRIRPVEYDLESSWRSDHRRQILDFTIDELVQLNPTF